MISAEIKLSIFRIDTEDRDLLKQDLKDRDRSKQEVKEYVITSTGSILTMTAGFFYFAPENRTHCTEDHIYYKLIYGHI